MKKDGEFDDQTFILSSYATRTKARDYILVYLDEYLDGIVFEDYDTIQDLDKAVENIYGRYKILAVGELKGFEYQAKEVVTKVERLT